MLTGPFKNMKLLRSPWSAINGQMSSLEYLKTGHLPSKSSWEDGCCMKREDGERSGPFIDWQNYNVFSLKQQLLLCHKRSITLSADTFLENILYWFYIRIHLSALEHSTVHILNKDQSGIFIITWFMSRGGARAVRCVGEVKVPQC